MSSKNALYSKFFPSEAFFTSCAHIVLYLFIPYTLEDISTGSFGVGLVGWSRMRETLNIVQSIFHKCFVCVLGANFESPLGRILSS